MWYSLKKVSKQRPTSYFGKQYAEVFFFPCFEHTTYFLCCFNFSVLSATFPRKFFQSAMELYYGTRVVPVHSSPDVSSRFAPLPTCLPCLFPSPASREYFVNKLPVTIFHSRTRVRVHTSYDRETVSNH